jgi:hypothetical protein
MNMKEMIPNFFKLVALVAVSAGIFFLVSTDKETQDDALANSLSFLGKKLLTMAPHGESGQVQEEFKMLEKDAMEGKVDPRELQGFAVTVLNLEAEGKKLHADKLATLVAEARKKKTAYYDAQRMHRLASQLHQYEEFQYRLKQIAPAVPHPPDSAIVAPRYRISPQFTIQIDTMRFAFAGTPAIPVPPSAGSKVVRVFTRTAEQVEAAQALAELSKELRDLKIEFGKIQVDINVQDSLRVVNEEIKQKIDELRNASPQNNP